jgi:ribosome-associated translation inhibitor RaiA
MDQYQGLSDVVVHSRGPVTASEQVYAHHAIARLARLIDAQMTARVDLVRTLGPHACALATAELTVGSERLDARAEAESVIAAVDALQATLRERLGGESVRITARR